MAVAVKVYGADWCEDTTHAREYLDRLGVAYEYVDVEQDAAAAEWVREQNARSGLAVADRGAVLVSGAVRLTGTGSELLADPEVGRLYLGADVRKEAT